MGDCIAQRGRKPKPTGLKLITGNPGKRELPENEPDFTAGAIAPPISLDDREQPYRTDFLAEWGRIVRQLTDWGIVGEVNQGALEGICHLYASFNKAARNSEAAELRHSFDGYRKALNEFGLTPASKGRVRTGETKKQPSKAATYFGA